MSEEKSGGGISLATKSRWKTPEHFFPVVVDDFFDDPEAFADFGKSLPKESDSKHGRWPGTRSKIIWEIDEVLTETILKKILSCYYDLDYITISWTDSQMNFQEIPRFSENKNDIRNKGWIHQDDPPWQLAGLIYLTPNIDPDSGTSLYYVKSNKVDQQIPKFTLYKSDRFDREEYTKSYIKHEESFVEKLRFQNTFNRLIMYDTQEWHRANNYYNGKDDRLTLSFFIGGLNVVPLKRIKNNEYESIIKSRLVKNENQ